MTSIRFLFAFAALTQIAYAQTNTPALPGPEEVKQAVQRSLPYLEDEGLAWRTERKCASCHRVTFMVWSFNEAKAHGLPVDAPKLEEWTDWNINASLALRAWYTLRPAVRDALKADGVPEAVLEKLKGLFQELAAGKFLEGGFHGFVTEEEFVAALRLALTADELEKFQPILVKRAKQPNQQSENDGATVPTMSQIILGRDPAFGQADGGKRLAALREVMLRYQEGNGSWQATGQLPAQNRPGAESQAAATMWAVLALASLPDQDDATVKARDRAVAWLKTAGPGVTNEWLMLRMLTENKLGDPAAARTAQEDLLGRQKPDGGWSWRQDNPQSDTYATGQVLYGLSFLGITGSDPRVQRAWGYLLKTQNADGHWVVASASINQGKRAPKTDPIYDYWGSTWAAIGLLRSLPPAAP